MCLRWRFSTIHIRVSLLMLLLMQLLAQSLGSKILVSPPRSVLRKQITPKSSRAVVQRTTRASKRLAKSVSSASVNSVAAPNGRQKLCNHKNPLIRYLKRQKVEIFKRPQSRAPFCQSEWRQYGTCCNPSGLKYHVSRKTLQNQLAVKAVKQEILELGKKIAAFTTKHLKATIDPQIIKTHKMGNGLKFVGQAISSKVVKTNEIPLYQELQKIGNSLVANGPTRVSRQEQCVRKINKVAAASTCSICSGRGNMFFDHKDKLKISESLCRSVLHECTDAWTDMIEIVNEVQTYTDIVRRLTSFSNLDGISEEKAFTMNLEGFIGNRQLIPIIQACGSQRLVDCPFAHVAKLCEQFIPIQSPNYVENGMSMSTRLSHSSNVTITNSGLIIARVDFDLNFLYGLQKSNPDLKWMMAVLDRISKLESRLEILKNSWINLKVKLPVMRAILRSTQESHPALKNAIANGSSTCGKLEAMIAIALIKKHRFLRTALIFITKQKLPELHRLKVQFQDKWDTFMAWLENYRFPSYRKKPFDAYFKSLEAESVSLEHLRNKVGHQFKTMAVYLTKALKRAVVSLIPVPASRKLEMVPKRRQLCVQGANTTASTESIQESKAALDNSLLIEFASPLSTGSSQQSQPGVVLGQEVSDPKPQIPLLDAPSYPAAPQKPVFTAKLTCTDMHAHTTDVNVIKDAQCNPCMVENFELLP